MRLDKGWNSYLFEYYHDGSWWCFEIPARSEQEARERVNKLPNAKHLGIRSEAAGTPRVVCKTHLLGAQSHTIAMSKGACPLKHPYYRADILLSSFSGQA
jgi:hypothetical protein